MSDKEFKFVEDPMINFQLRMEEVNKAILRHKPYARYIKGLHENYIEAGFSEEMAAVFILKKLEEDMR